MLSKRNGCYIMTAKKNPTIYILLHIKDEDRKSLFTSVSFFFLPSKIITIILIFCFAVKFWKPVSSLQFTSWPGRVLFMTLFVLYPLIALPCPRNTSVTNGNRVLEVYICSYNFQNSTHERDRPFTEGTHLELSALFCYCTIKEEALNWRGTFKKEVQERTINA